MTCFICQTLHTLAQIASAMPGMQPAQMAQQPMMLPQAQPMPPEVGVSTW